MNDLTGTERLVARSRALTLIGLAVLSLLAWLYLLSGAGMEPMAGMAMAPGFPLVAAMWWTMMVAMMVPSAAPTLILYARTHRHSTSSAGPPPTAAFLAGYLACWLGFSLLAAALQLWLGSTAFASPMTMALASRQARAAVLIGAGLYQLTPIKDACLRRCRSPAQFLVRFYQPGQTGALRLGLLHGAYCLGCCWLLMALLFVGGVMNLAWVAALTLLVAAEKVLPGGTWIARIAGVGMIAAGGLLHFA
jgi:predicted metal-binding membrane protein